LCSVGCNFKALFEAGKFVGLESLIASSRAILSNSIFCEISERGNPNEKFAK
jgi:hypothetical protein